MGLLELGVTPGLAARELRRIRTLNLLLWVGVATPLAWSLVGLLQGLWILVIYNCIAAGIFLVLLFVVRGTDHRAWGSLVTATVFLAGHHWCVLGPDVAVHAWFAALASLTFLMLDERSYRAATVWGVVEVVLFVLGQLDTSFMKPLAPFPHQWAPMGAAANTGSAAAVSLVVVAVFARQVFKAEVALEAELDRSERLLLNVLPEPVAERLKAGESSPADHHADSTVMFADLVGFTPLAESMQPAELVRVLSRLFSRFDSLAADAGLEKIKTIGDAYMVAAGVPLPRADHAEAMAEFALDIRRATRETARDLGLELSIRIGLHSGEVVAGVIGQTKFAYDLWGNTVNTASRMESHGEPGRIQLTAATRDRLPPRFICERRGVVDVKGLGEVETFWLDGLSGPQGHGAGS